MKAIEQYELTVAHTRHDHILLEAWNGGMHVGYFKVSAISITGLDNDSRIEISELQEKVQR